MGEPTTGGTGTTGDGADPKPKPDEKVATQAEVNALYARMKKAEEGATAAAAEAKALKDKELSEAERNARRVTELEAKVTEGKALEETVADLLRQEEADFPAEFKELVPAGLSAADRLRWLRMARPKLTAAKIPTTPGGKAGGQGEKRTFTRSELAKLQRENLAEWVRLKPEIDAAARDGRIVNG
jgi:hypothetical protein